MTSRGIQVVISLVMIVSLLTSATLACACDHHAIAPMPEASSCHLHEAGPAVAEGNPEASEGNTGIAGSGSECVCADAISRLTAKSEPIKLKKQSAAVPPVATVTALSVQVEAAVAVFSYPRLSIAIKDRRTAPKRGPPIL